MSTDLITVDVRRISPLAHDILCFELQPAAGGELPAFTAGAHIDVHMGAGRVRAYSLCNAQGERHRYVIAVARSADGRGGSAYMHDEVRVGALLQVSPPRNHFRLVEDAPHTVLIAGGIGITPLWSMAQRLEALGRSWELVHCARTRGHAAYLPELSAAPYVGKVRHVFDGEPGVPMLDIAALLAGVPPAAHVYCCGPLPMLDAFKAAAAARPAQTVHFEHFSAGNAPATEGEFTVRLEKSGTQVRVAAGQSILEALSQHQIQVPFSCREGTCGVCLTRVVSGIPDHRDVYLSDEEHDANEFMAICCSGARSPLLVLDI